ncbi:MAG: DUF262 domain-containing protein [Sciscionella sp.]
MPFESPDWPLGELLKDVRVGKVQLPDFQREWKWDEPRTIGLLATITRGYPIGVVMTLETGGDGTRQSGRHHRTAVGHGGQPGGCRVQRAKHVRAQVIVVQGVELDVSEIHHGSPGGRGEGVNVAAVFVSLAGIPQVDLLALHAGAIACRTWSLAGL